jgi:hypothetical protein
VYRLAGHWPIVIESITVTALAIAFIPAIFAAASERYVAGAAFATLIASLPAYSIWLRTQLATAVRVRGDGALVFEKPLRRDAVVSPGDTNSVSLDTFALSIGADSQQHIRIAHAHGAERVPLSDVGHQIVVAIRLANSRLQLDDAYISSTATGSRDLSATTASS